MADLKYRNPGLYPISYWDQWDDYMKAATNWAALFMLFSFLFLMAITYIESKDNAITLSYPAGLLRVAHITYEVALPTAFTVVTLYWVVVFDPDGSNTGWDMVSRVQNHACTGRISFMCACVPVLLFWITRRVKQFFCSILASCRLHSMQCGGQQAPLLLSNAGTGAIPHCELPVYDTR